MTGTLQTPIIKVSRRKGVGIMAGSRRSSSVRRLAASAFLTAGIGGILIACGAGDSSEPSPATNSVNNGGTSIGPEGGTVTENGVTITIPPGALAASTPIHITESTVTPSGYTVSGKVYRFEPSGTHFSAPIEITLPSTKPEIVYWTVDGSETEFEAVETDFDEVAATAKVQITHFSNGFVGTSPNGITCIVKQPSGICGVKTTIESPNFWYTYPDTRFDDFYGAIATDSVGLNRFHNKQQGAPILFANASHTLYRATTSSSIGDEGTATVANEVITSFTARAARGGGPNSQCQLNISLIDVRCSGGNVVIAVHPPMKGSDAGVSTDSGVISDAAMLSDSGSDSSGTDAAAIVDSGSDSSVADSAITDSGAMDSGVADSGVVDSGVPSAPSNVQSASLEFPIASMATATYPTPFGNNVGVGNLLVIAYVWNHAIGKSVVSVQDSVGTTYSLALQVDQSTNNTVALWYGLAAKSGANTITVTVPDSTKSLFNAVVLEYSGVTTLDKQHTWYSGVVSPSAAPLASFNSGSVATAFSREILIGVGAVNIPDLSSANPFSLRFRASNKSFLVEDLVDVSAGTHAAPFAIDNIATYNNSSYAAVAGVAAFH